MRVEVELKETSQKLVHEDVENTYRSSMTETRHRFFSRRSCSRCWRPARFSSRYCQRCIELSLLRVCRWQGKEVSTGERLAHHRGLSEGG